MTTARSAIKLRFKEVKVLETSVEFNSITVHMIREAAICTRENKKQRFGAAFGVRVTGH